MHFGNYWKHKKGGYYDRYPETAMHSEDMTQLVVYRSVKVDPEEEQTWVRPASMWDDISRIGERRFSPVTDEDFTDVRYHSLRCPGCGYDQPLGKFAYVNDAWEALRTRGHGKCETCDRWANPDHQSRWIHTVEMRLLKPLAERAMKGVKS